MHAHIYQYIHACTKLTHFLYCSSDDQYDMYGFKHEDLTESMTEEAVHSFARRQAMLVHDVSHILNFKVLSW